MRAVDRFILHVVHNWKNELNEAYSEKAIQGFINKFKEEADDLNIQVTDDQLKAYIERFDVLKNSPKVTEKDLNKWTLSKLIRLVTSTKGAEAPEEVESTPDVVYNQDGLTIYNGSKEDNCLNYGRGESWCITRGSFGNYRYDTNRKNPTFYLVKDTNLSDSDRKSFFVIVVGSDNTYKASDRSNNDVGGRATEWDRWEPWSFIEQNFPSVRGLRNIFKYIPLSSAEKLNQSYKNNPATIREFIKFPYSVKEQYLVVRKERSPLFSDVTVDEFVEKYLPKYPQLASFISTNYGIIPSEILVKHLDKFSNQDTRSIISNMRDKVKSSLLSSETIPFEVKKFLVKFDKWVLKPNERLYVTKDGNAIVKLTLGDDIKVGLYTEEDDYPSIKLNKRTSKYLLDYPELDKISLRNLLKLAEDEVIDKNLITRVLNNAKEDPNSAIIVKPVEGGEIILDSNSFSSYKIDDSGKISAVPFDNEEVQQVFNTSKDNESFQQNALNLFKTGDNLPETIDKKALASVINSIPYNQRTFRDESGRQVILLTSTSPDFSFFAMNISPNRPSEYLNTVSRYSENGASYSYGSLNNESIIPYLTYLRQINKSFDDNELLNILRSSSINTASKKVFIRNNPPINTNNRYKAIMRGDDLLVINTQNPRQSLMLSTSRNNLKQANISPALAAQLLGQQQAPAQPAAGDQAPRRGRPAGQPNTPRQQQAQPAAAGDINVSNVMEETGLETAFLRLSQLDRRGYRNLNVNNASRVDPNNDRGATRRNNILGNAGRVGRVIQIGASKIYFIRLANQQVVASINIQPGNRNYLLTGNANGNVAVSLDSPSQLLQALQQRNLAEIHNYLVNEYMERNPNHLSEFRQLLRQHINEKKKRNEQK